MQQKKGSNWIEMIIKVVNEFKLTVVHFARPNPVHVPGFTAGQKDCGKSGLSHQAAGPSRAVDSGPMGLRAAGSLGRRGPWAAGRWAAGLLLAKPTFHQLFNLVQLKVSSEIEISNTNTEKRPNWLIF